MSSPGAVKVNRPVAPWPKVYHTAVASMFLSCSQMHKVFANRWSALHAPIMTVFFKLHPEFCRRDTDKGSDTDLDKVITDFVKTPGDPPLTNQVLTTFTVT